MKLIAEEIIDVSFLTEENNGKKNHFIEGIFLQAELKNRNGRKYPISTLQREVANYNESYVTKGRALGELGHPDGPSINLDRVSHKIVSLEQKGNNFIGKAKLLETPMGRIAKNLLEEGVKLVFHLEVLARLREEVTRMSLKTTSCCPLLRTLLPIHPLQMLSLKVLWRVENGFGITVSGKSLILPLLKSLLITHR